MSAQPECRVCGTYVHSGPVVCEQCADKAMEMDRSASNTLEERCRRYREALVTLVGSDDPREMRAYRNVLESLNQMSADKQLCACICAIDALLADEGE